MVPESGPGTYQAAKQAIQPTTSYGTLIRYDVRVEDGLSIDPDKAAVLIQGVLDDKRSWRGTRRWRFELAPVGQSATLHAYIVTPKTTDRLCAPVPDPWRSVLPERQSGGAERQTLAARRRFVRL